jgi:hypothetical protein
VGGLIRDASGNFYGTASDGGNLQCGESSGCGAVFELIPNFDGTWTESVLYSFAGGKDGIQPEASLIFDSSGNLYVTTYQGEAYGYGTVFKLSSSGHGGWHEIVIHSFAGNRDGGYPYANLVSNHSGDLYGTATAGGGGDCRTGCGVVFKLQQTRNDNWKESVIYTFKGRSDGATPYGGLVFDSTGTIYGTTTARGAYRSGVVFKIVP